MAEGRSAPAAHAGRLTVRQADLLLYTLGATIGQSFSGGLCRIVVTGRGRQLTFDSPCCHLCAFDVAVDIWIANMRLPSA